jgi:hypothetical protein
MGNLCCDREYSVQFFVQLFNTVKMQFNLKCMGPLKDKGLTEAALGTNEAVTYAELTTKPLKICKKFFLATLEIRHMLFWEIAQSR